MSAEQFTYLSGGQWLRERFFDSWEDAAQHFLAHNPSAYNTEIAQIMQNNEGGFMIRPNTFHYFIHRNNHVEPSRIEVWYRGRHWKDITQAEKADTP